MTSPQQGDDRRPRITRTNSLFYRSARATESATRSRVGPQASGSMFAGRTATGRTGAGPVRASIGQSPDDQVVFVPTNPEGNPLNAVPDGYEFVRMGRGGIYVRSKRGNRPGSRPNTPDRVEPPTTASVYQQAVSRSLQANIQRSSTTPIGIDGDQLTSVTSPLDMANVDPNATFLFDRGGIIDPETGKRTGVLQSRGVYGSADSLERQLPAGETTMTGKNENQMTIGAGVLWLRNLAARDPDAYNRLVVLLRNAGYGDLPSEDAALPLNGYTNQVGRAFALAANDLAQANVGGDNRTLMEYLTSRGQGYADLLAQQEADAAAEEAYKPIDREFQDPATLKAAAKAAAVEALGRALTDEEEARFEAHFRGLENKLYDSIDAAGEAETSWSGYAPDVTGQADAFLDGPEFEQESANNLVGSYAQSFMRMMGVGG